MPLFTRADSTQRVPSPLILEKMKPMREPRVHEGSAMISVTRAPMLGVTRSSCTVPDGGGVHVMDWTVNGRVEMSFAVAAGGAAAPGCPYIATVTGASERPGRTSSTSNRI